MENDTVLLASEVMRLLACAGIRIALLETTSAGRLAVLLRSAPGGGEVVSDALVLSSASEISARLHVSPAKIEAFGLLSEMIAAEAAAALIDTYEGGWGLVLLGNCAQGEDVNSAADEIVIALGTPSAMLVQRAASTEALPAALDVLLQAARSLRS